MRHGAVLLAALGIAAGLLGCEPADPLAPPKVYFGEDLCDICSMIVSDERFAAACIVLDDTGEHAPRLFDDMGCMLSFERDGPAGTTIAAGYVRDYHGGGWIPWEDAFFVHSADLPTPMGSGLAALRDAAAADEFRARHEGDRLDLTGVRDRFRRSAP